MRLELFGYVLVTLDIVKEDFVMIFEKGAHSILSQKGKIIVISKE